MTDEADRDSFPSGLPKPVFEMPAMRPALLIVTGMSGAGRSKAADVLSDLGWYVVDNLPPQMLGEMVVMAARENYTRLAAIVDVRGGAFFRDFKEVVDDLEARSVELRIIFLEASDRELVNRFEQVRRPHPLQGEGTLLDGIQNEREAIAEVRKRADTVIDTSEFTVHDLADRMVEELGAESDVELLVHVQSFGYRNGMPTDADFVADVRFLDNPHWDPNLRPLTGKDEAVRDFVLNAEGASEFLDAYVALVDVALRRYRAHDKHHVTIAVGCTGGRHRSIAISEAMANRLEDHGYRVKTSHRDTEV